MVDAAAGTVADTAADKVVDKVGTTADGKEHGNKFSNTQVPCNQIQTLEAAEEQTLVRPKRTCIVFMLTTLIAVAVETISMTTTPVPPANCQDQATSPTQHTSIQLVAA